MEITEHNLEQQYSFAFNKILANGVLSHNRTGIDTLAIQHQYFYIKDVDNNFPIIRGKKVYPKMALKELIWMLMGRTDVEWLHKHKVTYWDEWVQEDGTIGKSYGYQYRNFNGVDQLKELINSMDTNPTSRRHIINLWNASDLNEMALPPCMYDYHFSCVPVDDDDKEYKIDMHVRARSNDSFLGVPYDFMFCGWFITLIAIYLNNFGKSGNQYLIGDIHYTADDYHMYMNHEDAVHQYINNVIENKENIITDNHAICVVDMDIFKNETINDIDDFLNVIEQNISTKYISIINSNTKYEYPTIKAEIAV